MKNLIILILVMSTYVFSQSWNTTVPTSIDEPNVEKMDVFTNRDGVHVVVQNSNASNSIKYYLLNSSGSLIRSATIETSGSAEFPNISGNNDKVYIVYKSGSNLKFRKSTTAGSSWGSVVNQSVGSNTCNGVDIVYDYRGLHVVYAMQDNGSYYETYYRLIESDDVWGNREDVTDYQNGVGGFPTVAVSNNRIHVGYNTGTNSDPSNNNDGLAKTRDKLGSTWQTPQSVTQTTGESAREKVQVRTTKLYDFYYDFWCDLGQCSFELKVKSRTLSSTSWSGSTSLNLYTWPVQFMGTEETANDNLHIIYGDYDLYHRYYNGSSWSSPPTELSGYTDGDVSTPLSFVSDDLHIVWKDYNSSYIKYRQWDDDPLAPQNLAVQIYTQGNDTYPKLTWTLNNEPDVYIKLNAYEIWRRTKCYSQEWSSWSLIGYKNGNQSEYIDFTISGLYAEACTAEYKIRAKDQNNHISPYSSTVSINFSKFNKVSQGMVKYEYDLSQNYPNPFNPTTQISYSLAQDAFVTLKVYDMLGTEVASLINDRKKPGNYSVTFNASNLPSGIYVYKLTSGNFTESKKLILLK